MDMLLQYVEYCREHQYKFCGWEAKRSNVLRRSICDTIADRMSWIKRGWNLRMADFKAMRENMVDGQVLPNQVKHKALIQALSDTPREIFVGSDKRSYAYSDKHIKIGAERFLIGARVFAGLVEALSPSDADAALDVGCGTGYGTVVLSKLCAMVVGIDNDPTLVGKASALLTQLEIDNAVAVQGSLGSGYLREAPYNVILVEGALPQVPKQMKKQLADGGRMAVVISRGKGLYEATLITRVGESFGSRVLFNAAAPLLPGFSTAPVFTF